MRLLRTWWFAPAILAFALQIGFACGETTARAVDTCGTTPAGGSARHVTLAVTFPRKKSTPRRIQPGTPSGVPGCVQAGRLSEVIVLPSPVLPSSLTSWQPVMPVLAPANKE